MLLDDEEEPDDFVSVEPVDFASVDFPLSEVLLSEPLPFVDGALLDDEPRLSVR